MWVMTSKSAAPRPGKDFLIGRVKVANIAKLRLNQYALNMPGRMTIHTSFSEAMKEMHRLLSSPPMEDED